MTKQLESIRLAHSPLSNRIVLAHFGKDETVALETRDAMNEFFQCALLYAFGSPNELPEPGEGVTIDFGNDEDKYEMTIKRKPVETPNDQPK